MTYISQKNKVSTANSSTATLNAGLTFTGAAEDVLQYESVVMACKTDQAGTLYIDFSPDGTNWDSTLSFAVAAATNEVHRITVTRRYCRVRFTNTSISNQTYFRLQTTFGTFKTLTSSLNSTIQPDADGLITRSVITGETDSGSYQNANVSAEGHLEVAVHGPRLPFGAIHTENLTPEFQVDAVYGINANSVIATTSGTGTSTNGNNLFTVTTGTGGAGSFGDLQSRKRLRYRPGQGMLGRFTALYSAPQTNGIQLAGMGTAETGFYFGYYLDNTFGILYTRGGVRAIHTLTVASKTTGTSTTVTLNGVAFALTLSATTNAIQAAYEISTNTFAGWKAEQIGATVVFVANDAGAKAGAFSVSGSVTGSFATTLVGVASTDTFIPQSSWNGDKMDGNGASGFTIDPTKGNVFQIGMQYLGFGCITFYVMTTSGGTNNPEFVVAHTIKHPNSFTYTNMSQPSMPFTMVAYSAGSTTSISVSTASFAGFVEGQKILTGGRFGYSFSNNAVGSGAGLYYALGTIRNDYTYKIRANQAIVNILSVNAVNDINQTAYLYLIRNGSISAGAPNFAQYSTNGVTYVDTGGTQVTITDNSQLLWTGIIPKSGSILQDTFPDDVTLQPGETITLAARSSAGSGAIYGSINTREDQ
jgi:hypothetical protein